MAPMTVDKTMELIGEAVTEYLPKHAIKNGAICEIDISIADEKIHLKMRVDSGLCVQMMEYPIDGKS